MNKKSLTQDLIDDLTEAEFRSAESWLSTHTVVWRSKLLLLCSAMRAKNQAKEEIWQRLYGDQPFDQSRWKSLSSRLLSELETWLSYRQFLKAKQKSESIALRDGHLLLELDRRQQDRLLKKRIRTLAHKLSPDIYWILDLNLASAISSIASRQGQSHFGEHFLNLSILGLKLRQASLSLSSQTLREHMPNIPLLDACLELAEKEPYSRSPAVAPYRLSVLLYLDSEKGEQYFVELRDNWLCSLDTFPRAEQEGLMRHALNFCIRKINIGGELYLDQALNLYKMSLSQGLIYHRGKISPFTFNNILGIALRLEKTEWAEDFLNRESAKLPDGEDSSIVALNRARLALSKLDFEGVLIALRQSVFNDFIHRMAAETLRLKAYWAMDYHDLLVAHLANTRSMLRRKKKYSYHVQNYRNIFDLARQIKRMNSLDPNEKYLLREEIKSTQPLTERVWLLSLLD
ncbi:MAG: hypothetical protein AAGF87_16840 [Bacteroidota bacterium]